MSDSNSGATPAAQGDAGAGEASFAAVLTPYRSLGRRGFFVLMGVLVVIAAFGIGRAFALGAWPVALFVFVDLILVYAAFRLSYRAARAFEEVYVWPHELLVRQVATNGSAREHRFNPVWARLTVTRLEDEGVVSIAIASHGRSVKVGSFLNPADRASFAEALGRALSAVRLGGRQ